MYTELEPAGPTAVGDIAGEFQLTDEAYERTFARRVAHEMGDVWFVVQTAFFGEYRDVWDGDPKHDDVRRVFLTRFTQWFWCTDPHLPESTHFFCAGSFDDLVDYGELTDDFDEGPLAAAARRVCADLDPATIVWSGLPGDIHASFDEVRLPRGSRHDNKR